MHLVGSFNVFPNFDFDQSPLLIYLEASNLPFVIDEWFAAILTLFRISTNKPEDSQPTAC